MSEKAKQAIAYFHDGSNCCQAVLLAMADRFGLDTDLAVRLGTGFGVGMARGGTCGAVSGAVMVLGLAHGGGGPRGLAAKTATYALARDFYSRFIDRHGAIICRDLIGLDPSTPDGLIRAREEKRFQSICTGLVRDAVDLTVAMLEKYPVTGR